MSFKTPSKTLKNQEKFRYKSSFHLENKILGD